MGLLEVDSSEESSIEAFEITEEPLENLKDIYDIASKINRISINKSIFYSSDLELLRPCRWLNDKIINSYFELLSKHHKKAFYFSTFLFPMLLEKSMVQLAQWHSTVDFSAYDCFFVPINTTTHWSLIKIEGNLFTGFDSLTEVSRDTIRTVKNFYTNVVLKNNSHNIPFYMRPTSEKLPRQMNGDDCGVFCCAYAKYYVNDVNYQYFNFTDIPKIRMQILHEILAGKIIYKGLHR